MENVFVFKKVIWRFCSLSFLGLLFVLGSASMVSSLKASTEMSAIEFLDPMLEKKNHVERVVRPHIKNLAKHRHPDEIKVDPKDSIEVSCQKLMDTFFKDKFWTSQQYIRTQDFKGFFDLYSDRTLSPQDILLANIYNYVFEKMSTQREEDRRQVLECAAALGHPEAQYQMHKESLRKGKYDEALTYLMSSATQGNAKAFYRLSAVYRGLSCLCPQKDFVLAKAFCQESAALGHDSAIFTLQVVTFTQGVFETEIDFQQGIKNALGLAKQNNKRAQEFLESMRETSEESLEETFPHMTDTDFSFLRENIDWKAENK